jgi:hypothetical protein
MQPRTTARRNDPALRCDRRRPAAHLRDLLGTAVVLGVERARPARLANHGRAVRRETLLAHSTARRWSFRRHRGHRRRQSHLRRDGWRFERRQLGVVLGRQLARPARCRTAIVAGIRDASPCGIHSALRPPNVGRVSYLRAGRRGRRHVLGRWVGRTAWCGPGDAHRRPTWRVCRTAVARRRRLGQDHVRGDRYRSGVLLGLRRRRPARHQCTAAVRRGTMQSAAVADRTPDASAVGRRRRNVRLLVRRRWDRMLGRRHGLVR